MQWSEHVDAADWIAERLHPFGQDVGSLLPDTFHAYARIAHAVQDGDRLVGVLTEPQLGALLDNLAAASPAPVYCWFAIWEGYGWVDGPPAVRSLSSASGRRSDIGPADPLPADRIRLPHRAYLLYEGPLAAARALTGEPAAQSPNLWWEQQRSWCVATEIDLDATYIGGSTELIDRLLRDDRLAAAAAAPTDPIGADN